MKRLAIVLMLALFVAVAGCSFTEPMHVQGKVGDYHVNSISPVTTTWHFPVFFHVNVKGVYSNYEAPGVLPLVSHYIGLTYQNTDYRSYSSDHFGLNPVIDLKTTNQGAWKIALGKGLLGFKKGPDGWRTQFLWFLNLGPGKDPDKQLYNRVVVRHLKRRGG